MKQAAAFDEIVKHFYFRGKFIKTEPYGCGHINDTYAVYFEKDDHSSHRYILQRINTFIFNNPEILMQNIENVTTHIKNKIVANGGIPERETLIIIRTIDDKTFYRSETGEYWRSYVFIEGAKTYQIVENKSHFYSSGYAFGKFQNYLSDFDAARLAEVIPNFHNTKMRLENFVKSVKLDKMNRAKEIKPEIDFVLNHSHDCSRLITLLNEKKIPCKVTHNDTKFNNVMIDDATGKGICVIDLDTVMPGSALYDFGDAIRSGATTAQEDEPDLTKVWLDLELFRSFTEGFMDAAGQSLTSKELEQMPFASKLMTLECGIRFLTDYLDGDVYFKIHREKHNLERARNQFKLVADMEARMNDMQDIIRKILVKNSLLV